MTLKTRGAQLACKYGRKWRILTNQRRRRVQKTVGIPATYILRPYHLIDTTVAEVEIKKVNRPAPRVPEFWFDRESSKFIRFDQKSNINTEYNSINELSLIHTEPNITDNQLFIVEQTSLAHQDQEHEADLAVTDEKDTLRALSKEEIQKQVEQLENEITISIEVDRQFLSNRKSIVEYEQQIRDYLDGNISVLPEKFNLLGIFDLLQKLYVEIAEYTSHKISDIREKIEILKAK